jgi:hypothetical protein
MISYEWHVRFSGRPKEVKVSNQKTDRREAESETARLCISLFHRFLRTNHRSRPTLGNCSKMFIHSCSVHYSHVFDSNFFFLLSIAIFISEKIDGFSLDSCMEIMGFLGLL